MAGLKEIRVRLQSVRNTKKITYAMKLVSAAKLRKAQEAVLRSREYTDALGRLVRELLLEVDPSDVSHPLMETHAAVKRICIVAVGGSRGLCGGYNTNLHKRLDALIREKRAEHPQAEIEVVLVGKKPAEYFRRTNRSYRSSYESLPEDANLWPVDEICSELEQAYMAGSLDQAIVLSTRFRSALSMSVEAKKLLPMEASAASDRAAATAATRTPGVTLFEPSAVAVWNGVIPRIMRAELRQAFLDAKASEHGSRMTAMDSATKNADDLSYKLQLSFNKLRQSRITSELLDIIGGAEAL